MVSFVVEHIGTALRHGEQLLSSDIFKVALGDGENQVDSACFPEVEVKEQCGIGHWVPPVVGAE